MNNPSFRDGLRLGATISAAIIALSIVGVLISSSLVALFSGSPTEPDMKSAGVDYGATLVTSLLILAPVVVSPWAFYGQGYGAALPASPVTPRFVAATMLAWLAMGATGVANPWVQHLFGQPQFSGLGVDDAQMTFLALNAGVTEEAAYLAAPTGLLFLLGSLLNLWRAHRGRARFPHRSLWLVAAIFGPMLVLVGRASGHLYQGTASAMLGVVWGAALVAVFVWARSVWPVMLGHIIYDLPVHYSSWGGLISHHVIAPAVIAAVCLIWIHRSRARSERKQAHLSEMSLPD